MARAQADPAGRAREFMRSGNFEKAIGTYSSLIHKNPSSWTLFNDRASAKERHGDLGGAIADYSHAIRLAPTMGANYEGRGNCQEKLGKTERALHDFDRSIELSPSCTKFQNRGRLRTAVGDTHGALADYNNAIELDPTWARDYAMRGALRAMTGDHRGALLDYTESLQIRPGVVEVLASRAGSKHAMGDFFGAEKDYSETLQKKEGLIDCYEGRAKARKALRDLPGALADMDFVISSLKATCHSAHMDFVISSPTWTFTSPCTRSPLLADALVARAALKHQSGDHAGALDDTTCALASKPLWAEAFLLRGQVEVSLRDFPNARRDLDEAIRLAGSFRSEPMAAANGAEAPCPSPRRRSRCHVTAYISRSRLEAVLGNVEASFRDCTLALEAEPRSAEALVQRGEIRASTGDVAGAVKDFDLAVEAKPNFAQAYYSRAFKKDLLLKEYDEALQDYDEALYLAPDASPAVEATKRRMELRKAKVEHISPPTRNKPHPAYSPRRRELPGDDGDDHRAGAAGDDIHDHVLDFLDSLTMQTQIHFDSAKQGKASSDGGSTRGSDGNREAGSPPPPSRDEGNLIDILGLA